MKPPSIFPVVALSTLTLHDGSVVKASSFCRRVLTKGTACADHYRAVGMQASLYVQCPFGFTTRPFHYAGERFAVSGVVAHPRFGSDRERQRAKEHPEIRTTRESIDGMVVFLEEAVSIRAEAIQDAAQVLPQAFHELRKLNGAILQHAEKELKVTSSRALQTIKSAAELMRNNFDILEALSNIDGMRVLPLDATINLYDLCYKTLKVFEERAGTKQIDIDLKGVRAIVPGSQKSFPIVPAVLIENAIKYGRRGTRVLVDVETIGFEAVLRVENETDYQIDPASCFQRGTRYAGSAVEGGGFGLFLAREVVAAHRGSIRCEPSFGKVRFIVTLPLERVISKTADYA